MRQSTKDALRWLGVPISYLTACLAVGAVSAWLMHGTEIEMSYDVEVALFYVPCIVLGVLAGALVGKDLPLKFLAALVLIPIGAVASFVSGVTVACSAYHACL